MRNPPARDERAVEGTHKLKEETVLMKEALLKENIRHLADILTQGWQNKKKTSSGVSHENLERIYQAAINGDAYAGKASGAGGGGGFMMFGIDPANRLDVFRMLRCRQVKPDHRAVYRTRRNRMEIEMNTYIQNEVAKTLATLELLAADHNITSEVEKIAGICCTALRAGNKLLFAGNGGSAADAQHLAGEMVSRLNFDRPGLAAFALTTDTSVLTAIGNDYGYNCVFARQLNAVGTAGDIFFAISTSGRSANILRGLEEGRRKGLITVGLTGVSGGEMAGLCDYCIRVPSAETPKIQEGHIVLGHVICGLIEREMFGVH